MDFPLDARNGAKGCVFEDDDDDDDEDETLFSIPWLYPFMWP